MSNVGQKKLLEYADMADLLGGGRIRIEALGGTYTSAELREIAAAAQRTGETK